MNHTEIYTLTNVIYDINLSMIEVEEIINIFGNKKYLKFPLLYGGYCMIKTDCIVSFNEVELETI